MESCKYAPWRKPMKARWSVGDKVRLFVKTPGHAIDSVLVVALQLGQGFGRENAYRGRRCFQQIWRDTTGRRRRLVGRGGHCLNGLFLFFRRCVTVLPVFGRRTFVDPQRIRFAIQVNARLQHRGLLLIVRLGVNQLLRGGNRDDEGGVLGMLLVHTHDLFADVVRNLDGERCELGVVGKVRAPRS